MKCVHELSDDFKPASVDVSKMALVDVGSNNTMTVTVPHSDGAGTPSTIFKGSQKPYVKECVLIIDRVTGEITLERLSSNIQVKKTRFVIYKFRQLILRKIKRIAKIYCAIFQVHAVKSLGIFPFEMFPF